MMQTMPEAVKRQCGSKYVQENFMTISDAGNNVLGSCKSSQKATFSTIHTKNNPKSNVALQGSAVRDITKKDKDILVQLRLET